MNPLKWSVWIRIALIASILWVVFVYFDSYQYRTHERFSHVISENFITLFIPVFLLWGGMWIWQGIMMRREQKKATKKE